MKPPGSKSDLDNSQGLRFPIYSMEIVMLMSLSIAGTEMINIHVWPQGSPSRSLCKAAFQNAFQNAHGPALHTRPYQLPAAVRIRLVSTVSHSFPSRLHFRRLSLTPPTVVTSFSTSMYMEGSELTWTEEGKHIFSGDSRPVQVVITGQFRCSGALQHGRDTEVAKGEGKEEQSRPPQGSDLSKNTL